MGIWTYYEGTEEGKETLTLFHYLVCLRQELLTQTVTYMASEREY